MAHNIYDEMMENCRNTSSETTIKITHNSITQRLLPFITDDYIAVFRKVSAEGCEVQIPLFAIEGAKPFTILNLAIANELQVPREKRIACASVIDSAARAIGVCDDILDNEVYNIPNALDAFGSFMIVTYRLLNNHLHTGLIDKQAYDLVGKTLTTKKAIMSEGIYWQRDNGQINNQNVTLPDFLTKYVDKIAGGLFEWAIEPLAYYHPPIKNEIKELLNVVDSFSRIFQIKDDIVDIIQDYKRGYLTTALLFIRDRKIEMNNLVKICQRTSVTENDFIKFFPETYKDLHTLIKKEENILLIKLKNSPIPLTYGEFLEINRNYRNIRNQIEALLPVCKS